jgi:hypothetical protein
MYETLVGFGSVARIRLFRLTYYQNRTLRTPLPLAYRSCLGKIRESGAGFLGSATKLQEAL